MSVQCVKFRDAISEEARVFVRDFLRSADYYEHDTGVVASYMGLYEYLRKCEYHAVFHIDCLEIVPIKDWVKEEVASFPSDKAPYYKSLLFKHLVNQGFSSEEVEGWLDNEGNVVTTNRCNSEN